MIGRKDAKKHYENCNELLNIKRQTLIDYEHKISNLRGEIIQIEEEKRDYGLGIYSSKSKRKRLINEGYKCGYSHKKLQELESINIEWNQDIVTTTHIDEFVLLEEYVNSNSNSKRLLNEIGRFLDDSNLNKADDSSNDWKDGDNN